jgi:hypothetical protein
MPAFISILVSARRKTLQVMLEAGYLCGTNVLEQETTGYNLQWFQDGDFYRTPRERR